MDDLERHLADFRRAAESRGTIVHDCATAADACATIVEICRGAGARRAAKAKSMATEEIGLNEALERAGVSVVETDLGEYILQLAGEPPVHIVAPAIEKTAEQVADLFSRVEGVPVSADLGELTRTARRQLREAFFAADVGITGANFGVAETGSICLATNEGNGRLVSSVPRVHVAVMGMERVVPTLAELAVLLKLLARSATGQKLTSYTTLLTGPRREGETDGPEEMHVVIIDNGRTDILRGRHREMLNCIRCGACINVCPVYRKAGGGAYGSVYSGPMGAVLAPLLAGLERAPDHPHASSLCGACTAACPVGIPLHELLLELRRDRVDSRVASLGERVGFTMWSLAWSRPLGYRLSTFAARLARPFAARAGPARTWASGRTVPQLARRRYRDR
jgi:L-lactate dehydrogenase complex protein LldF